MTTSVSLQCRAGVQGPLSVVIHIALHCAGIGAAPVDCLLGTALLGRPEGGQNDACSAPQGLGLLCGPGRSWRSIHQHQGAGPAM